MSLFRRIVRLLSSSGGLTTVLTGLALLVCLAPAMASAKETAKFRLVIEGTANATRSFTVGGTDGLCEEKLTGSLFQTTKFLRGKGVTLEISRKKVKGAFEYGVKRVGHGKSDFTVVASSIRNASGTESFTLTPTGSLLAKINPTVKCPEVPPDIGTTPGCNVAKTSRPDVGLKVKGNSFSVAASGEALSAPLTKPVCGESTATKGFLGLDYEFPSFAPTDSKPLPDAKMFGHANAIAVELEGKAKTGPSQIGTSPLTGSATDFGTSDVTVRFIRCSERKRPAC